MSGGGARSRSLWFCFEFARASPAWGVMSVGGESRAHDIASWHTPMTPLSEVAKAIKGEQRIKKVIKQFLRAGCGTRPSREGRAEGGARSGPPLIPVFIKLSFTRLQQPTTGRLVGC